MKLIAAAGFNPARQKVISFKNIVRGGVNRAVSLEEFASGKGINFCRAAACCGKVRTKLVQFCGGVNGDFVDAGLEKEGMDFISVRTQAPTRCCDTCIDHILRTAKADQTHETWLRPLLFLTFFQGFSPLLSDIQIRLL